MRKHIQTHKKKFLRSNFTALAATFVDFSILFLLVELVHLYYVAATAIGAFCGAITNFTLNRYWAFDSRHKTPISQGFRYLIVSAGSLALNTFLVYAITEWLKTPYYSSKIIAALAVGWFWNYPLHTYFVFPAKKV